MGKAKKYTSYKRKKSLALARDEEFWKAKMEQKLLDFYNKCLLPEIIDPRKSRSMSIRDVKY